MNYQKMLDILSAIKLAFMGIQEHVQPQIKTA